MGRSPATAAQARASNQFLSLHTQSQVADSITARTHLSQITSANAVECGFYYNQLQEEESEYAGLPRDPQFVFGERNKEVHQTLDVQSDNSMQLLTDNFVVGGGVLKQIMPSIREDPRTAASGIIVINGPPTVPENRVARDILSRGFEEEERSSSNTSSFPLLSTIDRRSIYITSSVSTQFPAESGGNGFEPGDFVYVSHTPVNVNAGLYIVKKTIVENESLPETRLDVELLQTHVGQSSLLAKLLSVTNNSFVSIDFQSAQGYAAFTAPYGTVRKVIATFMVFTEGQLPPFNTRLQIVSGDSLTSVVVSNPILDPAPTSVSITSPFDDFNINENPIGTFTVDVGKAFTRKTIDPNHYSLVIAGQPTYQDTELVGSVILKGGDDTSSVTPSLSGVRIAKSTIVGHSAGTAYANALSQDSEFFGYFSGHVAATQGTAFGAHSHSNVFSELCTAAGYSSARYRLFRGVSAGAHSGETFNSSQAFNTSVGAYSSQFGSDRLPVALGYYAGNTNPGIESIAIGAHAGQIAPGVQSICIGYNAGNSYMPAYAIAIGENCAAPQVPRRIAFGAAMEDIQFTAEDSGVDSVGPVPAQTAGFIPIEWNGELVYIPVFAS